MKLQKVVYGACKQESEEKKSKFRFLNMKKIASAKKKRLRFYAYQKKRLDE